jgi:HAE1 family hydrophobic/amphiphilic exporter-1
LAPGLKTEFFPTQDNARIGISIELPIGTRQEITRDLAQRVDAAFREKYPEVEMTNFSEGQAGSDNTFGQLSSSGTHIIEFNVRLYSIGERFEKSGSKRSLTEICELMRNDLDEYSEIKRYTVSAGGGQNMMGGEAAVDIEIYGYDFTQTDEVANEVAENLRGYRDIVSQVNISREDYIPEYQVDFDREKLAINGLNVTTASLYLRNRINGAVASLYREDGDEYNIRVRYSPEFRQSLDDISSIIIYNNAGQGIRIRDVAQIVEYMTPPTIERKNRERVITVSVVAAEGAALSDIVDMANSEMNKMTIPPELTWQLSGTYEEQQETFADLTC